MTDVRNLASPGDVRIIHVAIAPKNPQKKPSSGLLLGEDALLSAQESKSLSRKFLPEAAGISQKIHTSD